MRTHVFAFAAAALLAGSTPLAAAQAGTTGQDTTDSRPIGTSGTDGEPARGDGAVDRSAAGVGPSYRIVPGDRLRVEVYKDPQLSQALQVRPDGKITLPLIDDIQAAGLTPVELRDQVADALKEYVTSPVVTVIVTETVAPEVFVMGEVNSPGALPVSGPMTVMEALARAGGFREFANTKNIRILRKTDAGVQTLTFNYRDAARGRGEPLMLRPGDTVIVP
jgi:polysaccharide biosynthesis/export protein